MRSKRNRFQSVTSNLQPPTSNRAARLWALSVSHRVHTLLSQPRAGGVLATFARSCYVDLEGQIIAVVASDLLNGPLNIVVDAEAWDDRVKTGETAAFADGVLRVSGIEIDLAGSVVWDAALAPWLPVQIGKLRDHLPMLQRLLDAEAPEGGLARIVIGHVAATALETRVISAIRDLTLGLRRHDALLVGRAAGMLAGLGPGLTPSGDDVLVGALLALALEAGGSNGMRQAIVAAARDRTTRISVAYLDAAAQGEASEAWHRLIDALAGNDTDRITQAARQVITFGETSGSDMLAGFLLGLDALLR